MPPAGLAISLAEDLIEILPGIEDWTDSDKAGEKQLRVKSEREGEVPGTHTLKYESEVDFLEITHSAKNRKGLAFGAVLAAEYSLGKKGLLSMKEILKI